MSRDSIPESVLDTIRRLAEMRVDRGCTPAEAAGAAAKMEQLLERWQLTKFDARLGTYDELVKEQQISLNLRLVPQWVYDLASAVARPHDCQYFSMKHYADDHGHRYVDHGNGTLSRRVKDVTITFIGHASDAEVCQYLFETLSCLLQEMADRDGRDAGRSGSALFAYRKQYISAAAVEIFNRLWSERQQARQEMVESRALVVVKDRAVADYMAKNHSKVRSVRTLGVRRQDWDAVEQGRKAGQQVEIRRGVKGRDAATALLT